MWTRTIPVFVVLGLAFLALRLLWPRRTLDPLLRWGLRLLVRLLGIRVRVEGLESLDASATYTFMFHHTTAIDPFVFYGVLRHFGRGLEAKENFRIPLYGWLIRSVGNYPVDRSDPESARRSLTECARDAREGGFSIYCAPEGTRTRDGRVGPLKNGVFWLAQECGFDIVPLALVHLHGVLPPGEWRLRPAEVTVRVGDPVPVRHPDGTRRPVEELKDAVTAAWLHAGLTAR